MKNQHGNRSIERSGRRAAGFSLSCTGALLLFFIFLSGTAHAQQAVKVRVDVEQRNVYLGESFIYRVQVLGGGKVGTPDMSKFKEFDVREFPQAWLRYRGMDWLDPETLDQGTNYFFRMIALRTGLLTIPRAFVDVDGKTYSTPEMDIHVALPPPSQEFKLSLSFSKDRVYVGEPMVITAVWYFLKEGRFFHVLIPVLQHPDFTVLETQDTGNSVRIYIRSSGGSQYLAGEGGTEMINGVSYNTATFKRVIIPDRPGMFDFLPGTVQVWTQAEDGVKRAPDSRSNWNYRSTVVASNSLSLRVLPLPLQGRPPDFTGIVAEEVTVTSSVSHTEMNVGDPITLNIEMSGPPSLEKALIPPLGSIEELADGFSIRSDPMDVKIENDKKLFSQMLRVKNESVRRIPPIEVSYFNTRSGSYEVARSKPIPITVRPTRLLTASDLEGGGAPGIARTSVRDWEEGIRFNYTGTTLLLAGQSYGITDLLKSPFTLVLLGIPALLFVGALFYSVRRRSREKTHVSRGASSSLQSTPFRRLMDRLSEIQGEGAAGTAPALLAWREYMGSKLELRPGHLTLHDVEAELVHRGLEKELISEVGELFHLFELHRYRKAPVDRTGDDRSVFSRINRTASELERRLS